MWHRANAINLILFFFLAIGAFVGVSLVHLPANTISTALPIPKATLEVILQQAQGETKDLWMQKNGKRLHFHLESPKTRLIMKHVNEKHTLVEELEEMRLWMQDKLPSSEHKNQQIRFIRSPFSTFDFSTQTLATENTFIAIYTTPGEELSFYLRPQQISLKGTADRFEVELGKDGLSCKAKGFKGEIDDSKELIRKKI